MNKIIISSSCALSLLAGSGLVAFAQTDGAVPTIQLSVPKVAQVRPALEAVREAKEATQKALEELKMEAEKARQEMRAGQTELKTKAVEMREDLKQERSVLRSATGTPEALKGVREEIMKKAEAAREGLKEKREELRDQMEKSREELKTKREAEKEALKAKLEAVKDARKKEAVDRLDDKFHNVNEKLTTTWTNALNRLEELLVKIASRADKAATTGADVSATRTAIEKAKVAISAARTAVTAQTAKTYTITITTEEELRSAVAQTRDRLNQDLKAVRDLVQAAHRASVDALTSLKRIPRVDEVDGDVATTTSATTTQ